MWEFAKRFFSVWVVLMLGVITIAGGFAVAFKDVPWGVLAVAALLITVAASYRLFAEQQKEIQELNDTIKDLENEVWSARHGTNLLIKIEKLPEKKRDSNDLVLGDVYIANRRKDHTANVRFALIGGQVRLEAEGNETDRMRTGLDLMLPNPKHLDAGANRDGYLQFPIGMVDDLAPFTAAGVRLEIQDEQTDFKAEIELPVGSEGVALIQTRDRQ